MIPGSLQAVKNKNNNIKPSEMNGIMGRIGATFQFSGKMMMPYGTYTLTIMQKI